MEDSENPAVYDPEFCSNLIELEKSKNPFKVVRIMQEKHSVNKPV
jgi:hypothetical protein